MSLALAVALLALLVALFALVALVAVYARVRAMEAGRGELSGYAPIVGRPSPVGPGAALVGVLDADCALCHGVWAALVAAGADVRAVAVVDRPAAFVPDPDGRAELVADVTVRAALFEGYTPTLLAVDATGTVTSRHFVYADTDVPALVRDLADREVSRA